MVKMEPVLDLYNFDNPECEGSRYVLTSPRSLEACSRLHIKPVQLLSKPLSEFAEENVGKSNEFIQIMFNDWEEKRIKKLKRCRREREKIIMEKQVSKNKVKKSEISSLPNKNIENHSPKTQNNALSRLVPQKSQQSPRTVTKNKTESVFVNHPSGPITEIPVIVETRHSPDCVNGDNTLHLSTLAAEDYRSNAIIPRSDRSRCLETKNTSRLRSKSLESQNRVLKLNTYSLRSSAMGFASQLSSGYVTPQMQRDKKLVMVMKEKRKREEMEEKVRREQILQWSKQKTQSQEKKKLEEIRRQKELATSQIHWHKMMKKGEERRRKEMKEQEEELLRQQEEIDLLIKTNKDKQEKLRIQKLEDRKKAASERKQQQEKSRDIVQREVEAFQVATENDIKSRLERAERVKLESEMRELEKVKLMNKREWERFKEVRKLVEKKQEEDENRRRAQLDVRLTKAEKNHVKKVNDRNLTLKQQSHETLQKIRQTQANQKRIELQAEDHMRTIAQHKEELLQQAENQTLKGRKEKAMRAQKMRIASEELWKRNRTQVQEKNQELVQRTKEDLEAKDEKVKKHLQLKEAALEFSRVHAKINEAERDIVKRQTTNFQQMAHKAKLTANIGRGPRSSFVNYSTVKLG